MKHFTFWIPIEGEGDNAKEAWDNAIKRLTEAYLRGKYSDPPADIFAEDDPIPSAEILGGSLCDGFGIDNGEEREDLEIWEVDHLKDNGPGLDAPDGFPWCTVDPSNVFKFFKTKEEAAAYRRAYRAARGLNPEDEEEINPHGMPED